MMALCAISGVHAQSGYFNSNGFFFNIPDYFDGNTKNVAVVVAAGNSNSYQGTVTIPSTVDYNGRTYKVGAIHDMAFKGCKNMTSIIIPESVTDIANGAFYGCDNLTSIVINQDNPVYDSRDNCNAVIKTGTNTLIAGCKKTSFPSSVKNIGDCAFYGSNIASVIIPSTIDSIGKWAFLDCTGLMSLTIEEGVASIGNGAFLGCSSLTAIEIPSTVNAILPATFQGCSNLTELKIPNSVSEIEYMAFLECNSIETLYWNCDVSPRCVTSGAYESLKNVVLGDSITIIGSEAFAGCKNLKTIDIPLGVKIIGQDAFYGCSGLKTMTIPYGVEKVGYNTFGACDGIETLYWNSNCNLGNAIRPIKNTLKTIIIGDSVSSLDVSAFVDCKNLISVSVAPGNPVFDSRNNCNAIIESSLNKLLFGFKNTTIPEGVTAIADKAFSYCGAPKDIILPSSLLSIDDYAFLGCDSLASLVIPANVNHIGQSITNGCCALTSLSVDPQNAYYDSRSDCNAIIEKSTGRLIAGCNNSTIPEGITTIATYSLSGFSQLKSVSCPSSLRVIEDYAFAGCNGMESVLFSSSMDSIGSYAFAYCYSLLSINIPSGIKTIEPSTFFSCDTLMSIDIPASVEKIGTQAFAYCKSLKSISIPSTVMEIEANAFYGCNGIRTAGPKGGGYNYEFSWDTIPANAFMGLKNLESVVIPKTVKAVYECDNRNAYWGYDDGYPSSVFAGCYNLKSVSVSFKDTKLFRFAINNLTGYRYFEESAMDYNLYKTNPVRSITVLDDSIRTFSTILTGSVENLVLSDNVVYIDSSAFSFTPYIIYRANSYDDVYIENNIQDISVESGNRHFMSIDGVLFNKDGNQLVAYPGGRMGGYRIPASTTTIASCAFSNCYELTDVYIPNSVTQISDRAFAECERLSEVIIEGAPVVGLYAFDGCRNIQSVRTRSAVPGLMELSDSPQTIMAGERNRLDCEGSINSVFNAELGRTVSLMKGYGASEWGIRIDAFNIPSGSYKVSVGILPSPDNMLSEFHPIIRGIKQSGERVTLLDSIEELDYPPFEDYKYYMNDGNVITTRDSVMYRPGKYRVVTKIVPVGYDSVLIADSLVIPEGIEYLQINMEMISADYSETSSYLFLDRIFFEPLDSDMPVQRYAGTFTENVFNDATLYVPEGAVETYRNADGWKLFSKIEVDTKTYPADEIEVSVNEAGYATFYYSDGAYTLPQGLSAMVVSGVADDKLVYETTAYGSESDIIPAGVPVILVSDNKKAGSFKLRLSDSSFEYMGDNLLLGSDAECLTYSYGNSYFYKLSYGPSGTDLSGVPGWYWGAPNGGAFNIEAHKAWLAVPARFGTKAAVGFSMSGDDVTEALSVKADGEDTEPVYYDLNGRNLYAPVGGIITITNGTKVIIIDK